MRFKLILQDLTTGSKSFTDRRLTTEIMLLNPNQIESMAKREIRNGAISVLRRMYSDSWSKIYKNGDSVSSKLTIELEEGVSCSITTDLLVQCRTAPKLTHVSHQDAEDTCSDYFEAIVKEIFHYFDCGGSLVIHDSSGYAPLKEIDQLPITVYQPRFINNINTQNIVTCKIIIQSPKCECGKDKFGFAKHLEGCPKYNEKIDAVGVL